MSAVGSFGVLDQGIDAVSQSEETAIYIATLIFTLIAFDAQFLGTCKIDDEEFTMSGVTIVKTIYTEFKDSMRTR